jgi:hypothetical protein
VDQRPTAICRSRRRGYRDFGLDDLSPLREAQDAAVSRARRRAAAHAPAACLDNLSLLPPRAPWLALVSE